MLTPGYSKTQLDDKVNIFHEYPYTPYEANLTYYRSSNEDTFIRDLFKSDEMKIDEEYMQEQLDERNQLQIELTRNPSVCMTEDGDVLNYSTKEECEAAIKVYQHKSWKKASAEAILDCIILDCLASRTV